jgi:hypothetical protein
MPQLDSLYVEKEMVDEKQWSAEKEKREKKGLGGNAPRAERYHSVDALALGAEKVLHVRLWKCAKR